MTLTIHLAPVRLSTRARPHGSEQQRWAVQVFYSHAIRSASLALHLALSSLLYSNFHRQRSQRIFNENRLRQRGRICAGGRQPESPRVRVRGPRRRQDNNVTSSLPRNGSVLLRHVAHSASSVTGVFPLRHRPAVARATLTSSRHNAAGLPGLDCGRSPMRGNHRGITALDRGMVV